MRRSVALFAVFLAVLLSAGCAALKKASGPHPLAGDWTYSLETPMGPETGVLTVIEAEEGLSGSVFHMGGPTSIPLESITYEDGVMQFQLRTPALIRVASTVEGDTFEGLVENIDEGVRDIPIMGTRKVE